MRAAARLCPGYVPPPLPRERKPEERRPPTKHKVLEFMRSNGRTTSKEVAAHIGIPGSQASAVIADLMNEGKLRCVRAVNRKPPQQPAVYEVKEEA